MVSERVHVEVFGQGPALVLIHGWGLNSAVWQQLAPELAQHFEVHAVDLPGFGLSHELNVSADLQDWVNSIAQAIDKPAIWLGWSLGGLVATQAALSHPKLVSKLITVASSPKFAQEQDWPGIKPEVLSLFQQQLQQDFVKTLERFLAIQALGSESAKQDIMKLKQMLAQRPLPSTKALSIGLDLLDSIDLRPRLVDIDIPFLRIYGRLDSLVNQRLISKIDKLVPQSQRVVMNKASHAPFISHKEEFLDHLLTFVDVK